MSSYLWLILSLWISTVSASLVQTYGCGSSSPLGYRLADYIMDVIIDKDHNTMNFYITSKVINQLSSSDSGVMIDDVNLTSNRWTNLQVEIFFIGNKFVDENVRFCDVVNVKNTSEYWTSPRFLTLNTSTTIPTGLSPSAMLNGSSEINQREVSQLSEMHDLEEREEEDDSDSNPSSDSGSDSDPASDSEQIKHSSANNSSINPMTGISYNNVFNFTSTQVEAHCPLFVNDTITFFYQANIAENFHKLGSYTAVFTLISNELNSTIIGCSKTYITPTQPESVNRIILISVLVLLLATGAINLFTITYSSYQESSNPLLLTASTICNESLLKQLECTVNCIILYLQFALFIGALDLQYPGFYEPLVAQFKWCALLGWSVIGNKIGPGKDVHGGSPKTDNVYGNLYKRGLESLTAFSTEKATIDTWPNFMIILCIWMLIQILVKQLVLYIREFIRFIKGDRYMIVGRGSPGELRIDLAKNFCLIIGDILNNFMGLFALPFLILTIDLFYMEVTLNDKFWFFSFMPSLKRDIFNVTASYDDLYHNYRGGHHGMEGRHHNNTKSMSGGSEPGRNSTRASADTKRFIYQVPLKNLVPAALCFSLWCILTIYFIFSYIITIKRTRIEYTKNGKRKIKWWWPFPWYVGQNPRVSKLYTSLKTILICGFSYNHIDPSKVSYIVVPYLAIFLKSLTIGILQHEGSYQVAILSIIEFIEFAVLIYYQPFYVRLTWYSTRWILPFARLIVTLLCIPYIRELNVSEANRTYVAYTQFLIHAIVAVLFVVRLLYGFFKTIWGTIQSKKNGGVEHKSTKSEKHSHGHVNNDYEYFPVSNILIPAKKSEDDAINHNRNENHLYYNNNIDNSFDHETEDDEDLYYFRGGNRRTRANEKEVGFEEENDSFEHLRPERARRAESDEAHDLLLNAASTSANSSFHEQQKYSDRRKKKNDYTFREGDVIYKKFYADDVIDPEIKALWDSRNKQPENSRERHKQAPSTDTSASAPGSEAYTLIPTTNQNEKPHPVNTNRKTAFFNFFSGRKSDRNQDTGKGFEVLRPRPLIIKTKEQVLQSMSQENSEPTSPEVPPPVASRRRPFSSIVMTYENLRKDNITPQVKTFERYESTDSINQVEDSSPSKTQSSTEDLNSVVSDKSDQDNKSDSWSFIPQKI